MARFMRARGCADYASLWRWSVDDVGAFWSAIWDDFDVGGEHGEALAGRVDARRELVPGHEAELRRAPLPRQARRPRGDPPRVRAARARRVDVGRAARADGGASARGWRRAASGRGDRVAAYLPNIPETIAAFLATASLGAIWSSAAPEFGNRSVIDRFAQIEPKVLLAIDGYRYGGKDFDRREAVAAIAEEIGAEPVTLGYLDGSGWEDGFLGDGPLEFERGAVRPPAVGPLLLAARPACRRRSCRGRAGSCSSTSRRCTCTWTRGEGDRVFWFTTTGWMMWNFLVSVLLTDASIVLYDGNPGTPSLDRLWDLAEETGMTTFGTSASYIAACMKAGVEPAEGRDLSRLRAIGSTGSPLAPEGFAWVYEHVGRDTWLFSTSGGTDLCTAFVGGCPVLPVYEGELQCRSLGADIHAFDEDGRPVVDEVGELVIAQPMPSMPLCFWGDEDGSRYREAYFEHVPRRLAPRRLDPDHRARDGGHLRALGLDDQPRRDPHGHERDLPRGARGAEVVDALVVDVPQPGEENWMPLFVVLREGAALDDDLVAAIRRRVREDCSPRHVPSEVREIAEVPRTLSGKVLEVPVKRILMGEAPEKAASRDSLANPAALDVFVAMASS